VYQKVSLTDPPSSERHCLCQYHPNPHGEDSTMGVCGDGSSQPPCKKYHLPSLSSLSSGLGQLTTLPAWASVNYAFTSAFARRQSAQYTESTPHLAGSSEDRTRDSSRSNFSNLPRRLYTLRAKALQCNLLRLTGTTCQLFGQPKTLGRSHRLCQVTMPLEMVSKPLEGSMGPLSAPQVTSQLR